MTSPLAILALPPLPLPEAADNLELEVSNDGGTNDEDTNTIAIFSPITISSAANQTFTGGDPATAISTITVTDHGGTPQITATNDIRIRIPSGFNMTWDTSDTTATVGGANAGNVSSTVSYEDSGATLVIDVTTNFGVSDTITVSDLSFTNFSAQSPADNLELELDNAGSIAATDDKTITVDPFPTGDVAGSIFFDLNQNGTKDPGEEAAGLTLQVFDSGTDTTFNTGDDNLLASTTTGADGSYSLSSVDSGQVMIVLTDSQERINTFRRVTTVVSASTITEEFPIIDPGWRGIRRT